MSGADDNDFGRTEMSDDDALLAELRFAGELDQVPAEMIAAARFSFAWRTMDRELAELVADSAESSNALAGVRSAATIRLLTFQSATLTVDVEVVDVGGRRRLVGQLIPPQAADVEISHASGTLSVVVDEFGRFSADDVAPGPVSLRTRRPDGRSAITTDSVLV